MIYRIHASILKRRILFEVKKPLYSYKGYKIEMLVVFKLIQQTTHEQVACCVSVNSMIN
jgi:hypothetical protein